MKESKTRELVYFAFYVALFMVLDIVGNTLPIFKMPNGGSVGISTISILVSSYHLGWKKGCQVAMLCVLAQFLTGPIYIPNLLGFLLDYGFAFGVYGLASVLPNYKSFYVGVLITNSLRFLCSWLSGVIIWGLTWWGSAVYQATYMLPTLLVGLILTPIIWSAIKPILLKSK